MYSPEGIEKKGWSLAGLKVPGSRVYIAVAVLLVLFSLLLVISHLVHWVILVDGKAAAAAKNRGTAVQAVRSLAGEAEDKFPYSLEIKQDLKVIPAWAWDNRAPETFSAPGIITGMLREQVDFVVDGAAAIVVDGKELFCLQDRETAREVLDGLKDEYRTRPDSRVQFQEDVKLVLKEDVPAEAIVSPEEALEKLGRGKEENVTYAVKSGDTLWNIALENGISMDKLVDLNEDINPRSLQPGQEIVLARNSEKPVLNVFCSYQVVDTREIPYRTIERKDPSLQYGDSRVIREGDPGKAKITYRVTEVNGEIIKKEAVDRQIEQKPTPRVRVTGNKLILASRQGRNVYRPVSGHITSEYGMRHGRMHKGIDFAASYGAPVVAVSAGKIERVGTYGGYGKLVVINHGNGLVTRYAHFSRVEVKPGDRVTAGEVVGRAGATGNATGPHLHFEMWLNGRNIDPQDYFRGAAGP